MTGALVQMTSLCPLCYSQYIVMVKVSTALKTDLLA